MLENLENEKKENEKTNHTGLQCTLHLVNIRHSINNMSNGYFIYKKLMIDRSYIPA